MFQICGAVIEDSKKYLLVKGAEGRNNAGEWTWPGGRAETSDPSLEYRAKIETKEETGFYVKIGKKIGTYVRKDSKGGTKYHRHNFEARMVGGEPNWPNEEISEGRWFTKFEINELPDEQVAPFTKETLADYLSQK